MSLDPHLFEKAKRLIDRHDEQLPHCVHPLLSTLLPSGQAFAKELSTLCEQLRDAKNIDETLLVPQEASGTQVVEVLDALLTSLTPLLEQLIETSTMDGLSEQQVDALMRRQCLVSLSTQDQVAATQRDLLSIQPSLASVRTQLDRLLSDQLENSSVLRGISDQVRKIYDAALAYLSPLSSSELSTAQRKQFLQFHGLFQGQMLSNRIRPLEETLEGLKSIAPYHPVTSLYELVYACMKGDLKLINERLDGLPDELHLQELSGVREAFQELLDTPVEEDEIVFKNDKGEVCLGKQGWHHVTSDHTKAWQLENLARGWLLHRRPSGHRTKQWTVMSLDGSSGALHVIRGQLTRRGDYYRRFKDEASSLKSVDHPSVLRVLDWGRTPEKDPYLVTEPLREETLEDRLSRGRLSPDEMKKMGASLFESLHACHEKGITHYNIHPCTIQFRADNTPVLTGFGVSCQELETDEDGRRQDPYASPEQRRGDPLTPATDIYSLGSVLIDSVGGLQAVPTAWRPTLTRFVDQVPSARPSPSSNQDVFKAFTSKYYVLRSGEPSRGPYRVTEVAQRIVQGQRDLKLQRVGSLTRIHWEQVPEVAERVRELEIDQGRLMSDPEISSKEQAVSTQEHLPQIDLDTDHDRTQQEVEPTPAEITSPESFSSPLNNAPIIRSASSLRTPPQSQRVQEEYQRVSSNPERRFTKEEGVASVGYAPSSEVIAIDEYTIKLFVQGNELRSQYVKAADVSALMKYFDEEGDDYHFLSSMLERTNSRGDLLARQGDVQQFIDLLGAHLERHGRGYGERLSFIRVGGKGLFQFVIKSTGDEGE